MKIVKYLIYSLCIILCHACASTGEPVKYYSLTLDTKPAVQVTDTPVRDVIIEPVHLAKLLRQEGIVTQIGKNEVTVAHFHRWAAPLGGEIARVLVNDLNSKTHKVHFARLRSGINQHANFTLRLSIEKFNIRNNATVNIGGHYWLLDKNATLINEKTFDIKQPLTENGYSHAVEKLKQALDQLASNILADFNTTR